jgi:acetyl esterase/lipase
LDELTPETGYRAVQGVEFGELDRQKLDIFQPTTPAPPRGYPVLLFFYGGSWQSGDRADYRFVGQAFAELGILTLVADYRLHPDAVYPAFARDAAAATAWAHRHAPRYGGDPRALFLLGHSAGAYNAAMVAMDPRWLREQGLTPGIVRGWIGLAGPYDFLPITMEDIRPIFEAPHTPASAMPITHAGPGDPPALLISGRDDNRVNPRTNTLALARVLRQSGVPVEARLESGVSHPALVGALAAPLRWVAPVRREIAEFVKNPPEPGKDEP